MKAALRFTPLHRKYTYIYLEDGTIAKADESVLKFWKDGDIGTLLQKNNKLVFKPYAEDIQVVDFKPFSRAESNEQCYQHAGNATLPFLSEVSESKQSDEQSL
jgi:hypothetical protein